MECKLHVGHNNKTNKQKQTKNRLEYEQVRRHLSYLSFCGVHIQSGTHSYCKCFPEFFNKSVSLYPQSSPADSDRVLTAHPRGH